jgi:hypothetical protein
MNALLAAVCCCRTVTNVRDEHGQAAHCHDEKSSVCSERRGKRCCEWGAVIESARKGRGKAKKRARDKGAG